MKIERFINTPVTSNCYVIYDETNNNKSCVIIDPGSEDNNKLNEFITTKMLLPAFIILTHEHFDHCWGTNDLKFRYPNVKIVCSSECSQSIKSAKGNCSIFYDNLRAFTIKNTNISITNKVEILSLAEINLLMIRTPGHTKGSISIVIDNTIFTGDALIPGYKAVTKLPTSSKAEQLITESFFKTLEGYMIYPGHGDPEWFNDERIKWL